jgi:hypothetical protein
MPTIINPGATVTFDTREGGDTLSLTNNHEQGIATYTIAIDGGQAQPGAIAPGTSDNYDLEGHQAARVHNTGNLEIEADFE